MALYSQLLTRVQNIKIQSYPIAGPEATPVFLPRRGSCNKVVWSIAPGFCLSFEDNFSFAFALSLCSSKLPPAKNQPSLKQSQCTNQPAVLYLKKQSAAELPEKRLSLSLVVEHFLHLFESCSADVVRCPAARQQYGHQYY
jgi:hypothetical protein